MIPPQFVNFFIASTGAGGALVGLIFVAVSIAPEHIVQASAPVERQAVAASAFSALVNAFFISLGALLPSNPSLIVLLMSTLGLLNSLYFIRPLLLDRLNWKNALRRSILIVISLVIYGYEFYFGAYLYNHPGDLNALYPLCGALLGVYAIGLTRSWQLLGARRYGLLSWLNPLQEINEKQPLAKEEQEEKPA